MTDTLEISAEHWNRKLSELEELQVKARDFEQKWYQSNKERAMFEKELEAEKARLAKAIEALKKLTDKIEVYATSGNIENYSAEGGLGDVVDMSNEFLATLSQDSKAAEGES